MRIHNAKQMWTVDLYYCGFIFKWIDSQISEIKLAPVMSLQLTGIGFKGIGFANVLKEEMHSTQKVKKPNFCLFTRKFLILYTFID